MNTGLDRNDTVLCPLSVSCGQDNEFSGTFKTQNPLDTEIRQFVMKLGKTVIGSFKVGTIYVLSWDD
jgi:hypothetical protein